MGLYTNKLDKKLDNLANPEARAKHGEAVFLNFIVGPDAKKNFGVTDKSDVIFSSLIGNEREGEYSFTIRSVGNDQTEIAIGQSVPGLFKTPDTLLKTYRFDADKKLIALKEVRDGWVVSDQCGEVSPEISERAIRELTKAYEEHQVHQACEVPFEPATPTIEKHWQQRQTSRADAALAALERKAQPRTPERSR